MNGLRSLVLLGCLCVVSVQVGCSSRCMSTCEPGERRCSTLGVLFCTQDLSSGCFTWGLLPCQVGQSCQYVNGIYDCAAGTGTATPEECLRKPYHQRQCVGRDIYWFDACGQQRAYLTTCSTQTECLNGTCQPLSSGVGCTQGQQQCFEGTRRCNGISFQECKTDQAKGCTYWGQLESCPQGQYCAQGACAASPSSCPQVCQAGAKRCAGVSVQVCEADPVTRCLRWSQVQQCPSNQSCQKGACQAGPGNCPLACSAGAARCVGDKIQRCTTDAKGCLVWSAEETCPNNQSCSNNECQGSQGGCKDLCASGAKRCVGVAVQSCERAGNGCLEWSTPIPCPTGQGCQAGACQSGGSSCQDQCREGDTRCQGVEIQSCQRQGQCTTWVRSRQCGANQSCKSESNGVTCACKAGFKPAANGTSCEPDSSSALDCGMNQFEKQTHEIVNQERQKQGLAPLKCHANIVRESREWSKKQCARGSIGHDGASGRIQATGLSWSTWGENVAAGQSSPADVMRGWMNSPGHRANILKSAFTHLGVGYYNCGKGYKHYWTQLFMKLR